jgi:hypothetical protein
MGRTVWIITVAMLCAYGTAVSQPKALKDYSKGFKGSSYWLKLDLVEVQYGLRGVDAVNVMASGDVVYRMTTSGANAQSQTPSSSAFIAKARLDKSAAVRVLEQGRSVVIRSIKFESGRKVTTRVAHIRLEDVDGVGHSVRLHF